MAGPMAGRVCIVTGANSGIGRATAAGLTRLGATVVLACRDLGKAEATRRDLARGAEGADLRTEAVDLLRQASVRAFAGRVLEAHPRVHVIVNNAGVYAGRGVTEDGIEATFAVNYLSHFLLTRLLLDRIEASAPSRIVNVTSAAHRMGTPRFHAVTRARGSALRAYGRSKLAQILFTRSLARRLAGTGVTVNCAHPGGVRTRFASGSPLMRTGFRLAWPFLLPPARGADTILWLASSDEVSGRSGGYYVRRRLREPSPAAADDELARRLWDLSESLVGPRAPGTPP